MPRFNARGVIAETYDQLQAIPLLRRAREAAPLPRGSAAASARAIFQSAEIVLHNLADLTRRAAADAPVRVAAASSKLAWVYDFHLLLAALGRLAGDVAAPPEGEARAELRIADSPALREYAAALDELERVLGTLCDSGALPLEDILAEGTYDDAGFRVLHLFRISAHEAAGWERSLARILIAVPEAAYEALVAPDLLRRATVEPTLAGDTYFTQFRALHQVPELLGAEAGDRLEQAILALRGGRLAEAAGQLRAAAFLLDGVLAAVHPLVVHLAPADYHRIRENLGLTSGSHSTWLRHDLFGDLYPQLWSALLAILPSGGADTETALQRVGERRHRDAEGWLLGSLVEEARRVGVAIGAWREAHLHLPRNHLGGGGTKSLAGSPDGLRAVELLREAAARHDPARALARTRGGGEELPPEFTPLAMRLNAEGSLDRRIREALGRVTRERFPQVQDRSGPFAGRCPFSPPPRRIV